MLSARLDTPIKVRRPSNSREITIKRPTPIFAAVAEWYTEIFDYLAGFGLCLDEECTVDDSTNNPRSYGSVTPLHIAALAGKVKMVTSLVKNGADLYKQTTLGDTPVFEACFEGHLSVVKYLVEAGADLSISNNRKTSCLMIASYADNSDVIKYLIEQRMDVNVADVEGRNAMFYTVAGGRLDTLIFLFDNGCQVPCVFYVDSMVYLRVFSAQDTPLQPFVHTTCSRNQ